MSRLSVLKALPFLLLALLAAPSLPAAAQQMQQTYSSSELVNTGHKFFGEMSGGLASAIERAASSYGQPNGYILGQEGSGAFLGGLRYGEGTLYTRNAGSVPVYWQGPTLGLDVGGDGARTMILVYNLPSLQSIYRRFGGVAGSAYFIGGFGLTALTSDQITLVPVRTGVGARLGVNVGYLKFTPQATWNPF
ncbi:DUF1134 domain-containing protein [Pleomorphomonas koreensis]|uniref:DUF1134 domain-containing protein n=1 Tax=Pleomorphomonas koreensis TaxID=257440 RepID=UPI00040BA746|nr:DUF1134 domain-containing protein [Pleomorphomonas koreensis]